MHTYNGSVHRTNGLQVHILASVLLPVGFDDDGDGGGCGGGAINTSTPFF